MPNSFPLKNSKITLRPATAKDEKFLRKAYESSRDEEANAIPWQNPSQRKAFFDQQFHAQSVHYKRFFTDADFDIIEYEGKPAGRVIHLWSPGNMHLVDIIVVTKYRWQGIGTAVIEALLDEVDRRGISASLKYPQWWPQMGKYFERYGFKVTSEHETRFGMTREKK